MHPTAALEANLWSMWRQLGEPSDCTLGDRDGALWVQTPLPVLPYNMVLRYQGEEGDDHVIDEIFARFEAQGVPFLWFVHPSARPADLPARLRERGFDEDDRLTGMAADLEKLPPLPEPPADVELVEVTPESAFSPFIEFVANRWQVPESARSKLLHIGQALRFGAPGSPNRAWLVVKDGVPLAKAVTHESHDAVGLYGMVTQAEARGLGQGRFRDQTLDAEAMAELLYELDRAARAEGIRIWRVIFDPELQPLLHATSRWPYLEANLTFSTKRSWVRHDEHFHVDFDLPCRAE